MWIPAAARRTAAFPEQIGGMSVYLKNACTQLTWNTRRSWIEISSPSWNLQQLQIIPFLKNVIPVTSSFSKISPSPPGSDVATVIAPPAVWKSFSERGRRENSQCSPSRQLFTLACVHPLYVNTWAAFVSPGSGSGYRGRGSAAAAAAAAVCFNRNALQERKEEKKGPCGSLVHP